MSKRDNNKRWFDEEDFTPEHDEMMVDLLTNWKEYLTTIYKKDYLASLAKRRLAFVGSIEGEPILEGYPPVFPDAIATYRVEGDHRGAPVTCRDVTGLFSSSPTTFSDCSICGVSHIDKHETVDWICQGGERGQVIFEIKPRITSFGSILRQLVVYKSRKPDARIILLTKDSRYDNLFRSQGFHIAHPRMLSVEDFL